MNEVADTVKKNIVNKEIKNKIKHTTGNIQTL